MVPYIKVVLFVRHWHLVSDDELAPTTDVRLRRAPREGFEAWVRKLEDELEEDEFEAAMCGNDGECAEIVAVAEDWDLSATLIYGHDKPLADIVRQLYDL